MVQNSGLPKWQKYLFSQMNPIYAENRVFQWENLHVSASSINSV